VAVLLHAHVPAPRERGEQRLDPVWPFVGHDRTVGPYGDLLLLDSDAERRARLGAGVKVRDEVLDGRLARRCRLYVFLVGHLDTNVRGGWPSAEG
jgi:hypothetical protein